MSLSIVCPVYNEEAYILPCLESILSQENLPQHYEILVVDGLSEDSTRELLDGFIQKHPQIRLLDNPQRIVPVGLNIALREARYSTFIRIDAHCKYPSHYIAELLEWKERLGADNVGFCCDTLPGGEGLIAQEIARAMSSPFGVGMSHFRIGTDRVQEVDTVPFGCYSTSLLRSVGGWDEELLRNQDDELNARLRLRGGKIYLIPTLRISYYARDSFRKLAKMLYGYGLFKPLVGQKLGKPASLRQFAPPLFIAYLLMLPLWLFALGEIALLPLWSYLFFSFLATLLALRGEDRKAARFFLLSYAFFLMHSSYGWGYLRGVAKLLTRRTFYVDSSR